MIFWKGCDAAQTAFTARRQYAMHQHPAIGNPGECSHADGIFHGAGGERANARRLRYYVRDHQSGHRRDSFARSCQAASARDSYAARHDAPANHSPRGSGDAGYDSAHAAEHASQRSGHQDGARHRGAWQANHAAASHSAQAAGAAAGSRHAGRTCCTWRTGCASRARPSQTSASADGRRDVGQHQTPDAGAEQDHRQLRPTNVPLQEHRGWRAAADGVPGSSQL